VQLRLSKVCVNIKWSLISELDEVEIDSTIELGDELRKFQVDLRLCVIRRFETDNLKGQKVMNSDGIATKLVAIDVFNNAFYVLAAILDPRVKMKLFDGNTILKVVLVIKGK